MSANRKTATQQTMTPFLEWSGVSHFGQLRAADVANRTKISRRRKQRRTAERCLQRPAQRVKKLVEMAKSDIVEGQNTRIHEHRVHETNGQV